MLGDQIDTLSSGIVDLYLDLENSIIQDIAKRIVKMGSVGDLSAWQMQRLTESGSIYKSVLTQLAGLTDKSYAELRTMFTKAGVIAIKFDDSVYKAVGLKPLPLNQSPAMVRVLKAGLDKTKGLIDNLVMTTAYKSQQTFIKAADLAYTQMVTGTRDYQSAVRAAVKSVGESGIGIIYPSGRADKLDVAMFRAVRTGVSQTGSQLQMTRASEMGVDLVQVSKHMGSRPSHAAWEGKIFSLSGKHPKYPNFYEATGYGTGAGLGGWNCRHSWYPYFEELARETGNANPYDKAAHQDYEKKRVKYNDEQISIYEATQKQRELERNIRLWKRQRDALNAAGLDSAVETAKVSEYQGYLREFISQTRLERQRFREQV